MYKIWNTYRLPIIVVSALLVAIITVVITLNKFVGINPMSWLYASSVSAYFGLTVNAANIILDSVLPNFHVTDQALYNGGSFLADITDNILAKKWFVFLLFLIWIMPGVKAKKMGYSLTLIVINFLLASTRIIFIAFVFYWGYTHDDATTISPVITNVPYQILFFMILHQNKHFISQQLTRIKVNGTYIRKFFPTLVVVVLLSTLFNHVIVGLFEFNGFIKTILSGSQGIVFLFGYNSFIDGRYLLGEHGNVYMAEYCIGLKTMMIFSVFVFLTGVRLKPKLLYILTGVISIVIINIIRVAYLFIHMQKYGEYTLTMDVHDMFNYTIYAFVFILWVIWLEKFTDIWPHIKEPKSLEGSHA